MVKLFRFILTLVLVFFAMASICQENVTGLNVTISNIRNNKGHVLVSLFKDGNGYPNKPEKAYRNSKVSINNNSAFINLTGLPNGNYSIAILHDENNDTKMNTNFLGLPKEGYGFSNNVMGKFGPPSLSKATFQYNSNEKKSINIRVRY